MRVVGILALLIALWGSTALAQQAASIGPFGLSIPATNGALGSAAALSPVNCATHQWVSTLGSGGSSCSQPACGDLSTGGTACTASTGTSGGTVPFLNGNNTWSGTNTFQSTVNSTVGYQNNGHPAIEFQLVQGLNTFGNNTSFATGLPVAFETPINGGTIQHLSCRNISGGTCSGAAPTFNVYKIHSAVETDGTPLTCSTTQQGKGVESLQTEAMTYVPGDEIGVYISTQGNGCNAPIFDVDALVSEP